MQAIRVRQRLNSETLTLPQLRPFMGKEVEIVISDLTPEQEATKQPPKKFPLEGSVLWDDDPLGPAVSAEEKLLKTLDSPQSRSRLAGSILRDDDDPFGPAVPAEEWEANR